ncbi:type II toxin-antitoxin system VapC family toxin [bacterium]|nr:type II toxin-antitoxin system VapC family toxin [bacterium]
MLIVIDTSVVIAVITNEKHKNKLIQHTIGCELIAPQSLHWEISNAFSAMFKRNRLTLSQARTAIDYYQKIPIRFLDIDLKNALSIAYENNIYAYDAYFIECAIRQKAALLTLDDKLKTISKTLNIKTIEVEP